MTYDWQDDAKGCYDEAIRAKRAEWLVENIPGVKRARVIGRCELMQGDCLEIMPHLEKVDALIWDPPWGIGFSEYNTHKDDPAAYPAWIDEALTAAEALVVDGWCVVFQGARRAFEWSAMIKREFRVMACAKNFTQILPGAGPIWSTDFALFWKIGTPRVEHGRGRDFHLAITSDMRDRPKGHPCPRPLDQMKYLVECFSEKNFSLLDPTMGSGTTLVACAKLGRRGIGIELDSDYFDIACRRVEEAYRQPDLFVDQPKPEEPKQEAMDL